MKYKNKFKWITKNVIEHNGNKYFAELTLQCYSGKEAKTYGEFYKSYPAEENEIEILDILILEDENDTGLVNTHVDWSIDKDNLFYVFNDYKEYIDALYECYCE